MWRAVGAVVVMAMVQLAGAAQPTVAMASGGDEAGFNPPPPGPYRTLPQFDRGDIAVGKVAAAAPIGALAVDEGEGAARFSATRPAAPACPGAVPWVGYSPAPLPAPRDWPGYAGPPGSFLAAPYAPGQRWPSSGYRYPPRPYWR